MKHKAAFVSNSGKPGSHSSFVIVLANINTSVHTPETQQELFKYFSSKYGLQWLLMELVIDGVDL
jgi:hypothetical protein